jgi:transcription antitermination factor NusG
MASAERTKSIVAEGAVACDLPRSGAEEPPNALPWYAIRVRSNCEKTVLVALAGKGYEVFLPTYRTRRRWSDRYKQIDSPLFSGYTFCRLDASRRLPVLTTPGVVSIVGTSAGPLPIEEREMDSVRMLVSSGLIVGPFPFLREGQFVALESGPLAGVEGVIVNVKNQFRLVVSISLLQRSISVEIDRAWVRPVSNIRS